MEKQIRLKHNKYGNYQFATTEDLIRLWVSTFYKDKAVAVLFDSFAAFDSIPMLNILKRDNFSLYMAGLNSEFTFVEFDEVSQACDLVYGFDHKYKIKWIVFNKGRFHTRSK